VQAFTGEYKANMPLNRSGMVRPELRTITIEEELGKDGLETSNGGRNMKWMARIRVGNGCGPTRHSLRGLGICNKKQCEEAVSSGNLEERR
jgi:hypothetical protein